MEHESRQQRRFRERQMGIVQGTTAARAPNQREEKSARIWYISFGVPAAFLAIGLGAALASVAYFWHGIGLAFVGIVWLWVDWWVFSKEFTVIKRIIGAMAISPIAIFIGLLALRPAPLGVTAIADDAKYQDGSIIDGITWRDRYYPMRLIIDNTSGEAYRDLEIFVRTDLIIKDMGFNSDEKCSFRVILPGVMLAYPESTVTTPDGRSTTKAVNIDAGSVYRISCEKLSAGGVLEFIAAIVPNPPNPGRLRSSPSWAVVEAKYVAFSRPESVVFRRCFIERCKHIPKLMTDGNPRVLEGDAL